MDTATVANVAIAVSALIALVFGIVQVLSATRDRRERLTVEVIRAMQTRTFAEHVISLQDRPPPPTAKEWQALPEPVRVQHVQYLQSMEMLGLLVADATIDIDLVERSLGSWVSGSWARFKPAILELRTQFKDPYLAEYFQWLAERVDERMAGKPRRPAYEAEAAPST